MGKMSLTSCRALSTPGKFSNVDRYVSQFFTHVFSFLVFAAGASFTECHMRSGEPPGNAKKFFCVPLQLRFVLQVNDPRWN